MWKVKASVASGNMWLTPYSANHDEGNKRIPPPNHFQEFMNGKCQVIVFPKPSPALVGSCRLYEGWTLKRTSLGAERRTSWWSASVKRTMLVWFQVVSLKPQRLENQSEDRRSGADLFCSSGQTQKFLLLNHLQFKVSFFLKTFVFSWKVLWHAWPCPLEKLLGVSFSREQLDQFPTQTGKNISVAHLLTQRLL